MNVPQIGIITTLPEKSKQSVLTTFIASSIKFWAKLISNLTILYIPANYLSAKDQANKS